MFIKLNDIIIRKMFVPTKPRFTNNLIICYIQKFCVSFEPLVLKKVKYVNNNKMEIGATCLKCSKIGL